MPYEEIVKGYEYTKGKFVVMEDEDFRAASVENWDWSLAAEINSTVVYQRRGPVSTRRPPVHQDYEWNYRTRSRGGWNLRVRSRARQSSSLTVGSGNASARRLAVLLIGIRGDTAPT